MDFLAWSQNVCPHVSGARMLGMYRYKVQQLLVFSTMASRRAELGALVAVANPLHSNGATQRFLLRTCYPGVVFSTCSLQLQTRVSGLNLLLSV